MFLCCLALCVCTPKEHVSDHLHALHCPLILTRGSGCRPLVRDHRVARKRPCGQLVVTSSNTQWVRFRELGRPKCFSGREDEWHGWSLKFGAIASTLSDHASVRMNGALQHTTEITLDHPDEASARMFARQLYTLLFHLCEGRALAIIRGAPDHNGLEAWRLLHEWY